MTTNTIDKVTGKLLTNGLTDDWTMLIERSTNQFQTRLFWFLTVVILIAIFAYTLSWLVGKYMYPTIPPNKKHISDSQLNNKNK